MNVGRYLRGEDRHVGTARTTQPQPPQRTEQEPVAHPERHELQAKGEHPAPCARHCEANAFQIVIKNLKAQLAQPKQEPVIDKSAAKRIATALGWTPQRKPLTDEDLIECERLADIRHRKHMGSIRGQQLSPADQFLWHYARAIEAAHGIKE